MIDTKWTLTRRVLDGMLMKKSKYSIKGLLLEPVEFAGKIIFEDYSCRIVDDKLNCDKRYKSHTIVKGSTSSVRTPISIVNFHTHPLHCYVDAGVTWG